MKLTLRTIAVSSFFASLPVASNLTDPSLAENAGVDYWNLPAYQKKIQDCEQTNREIEATDKLVCERTAKKIEIARAVIDGKTTFEAGVARFVQLNRMNPPIIVPARIAQTESLEQLAANQLLAHIRVVGGPGAGNWPRIASVPGRFRTDEPFGYGLCCSFRSIACSMCVSRPLGIQRSPGLATGDVTSGSTTTN